LLLFFVVVVVSPRAAEAWQKLHVKGYTTKDGTKVHDADRSVKL
jgi:hypothetical protein